MQDVGAGDDANPLYETNQSALSAPDEAGAYGGAVLPLPSRDAVSQQASQMSARSRSVRLDRLLA
jgi:hypothetical protein